MRKVGIRLFIVWCICAVFLFNVYSPRIRFTDYTTNVLTGTLVLYVVLIVSAWSLYVALTYAFKRHTDRVVVASLAAVVFLISIVAAMTASIQTLLLVRLGAQDSCVKIARIDIGRVVVNAYRTNGGATTAYGILVRREQKLLPGILYVRDLIRVYPAARVTLTLTDTSVEVMVPPYQRGMRTIRHRVFL